MNAVIYARYSSDKQTEQSIEGQLRVCYEYAERNNINIVNQYIDRAMTGTNDKRPAFLQMIGDSAKKEFDYVIVYKLDRFSRSKYDNVIYKHKLEQYGVKVISATEVISDTPEGRLMEGLLEMFAEMYSQELSQKVKRGMRESLIKGNYAGGKILYGYKVVNKKVLIDEESAKNVRYFFEEYAKGKPKKQIIDELNVQGGNFNRNSFQNTLSNKKYIGIFDNGNVRNENFYPAIISQDLFDMVQERLKMNKQLSGKRKAKEEYLLTGKLFCARCGASMVGVSAKKRYKYYACYNRWRKHSCGKEYENKEDLEYFVATQTVLRVGKEKESIIKGMLKKWTEKETNLKLKECTKNLSKIEKELDKCAELLFGEINNDSLIKRIKEKADSLEIQKNDLNREINRLKMAIGIVRSEETLRATLDKFLTGNLEDVDFRERIIKNFINAVYIDEKEVVIFYNAFDDKKNTNKVQYNDFVRILNEMVDHSISNTKKMLFFDDYFVLKIKRFKN